MSLPSVIILNWVLVFRLFKDLEVRGAGNLLGGEQHGQLDAVGYDLYNRMLDKDSAG